MYVLLFPHSCSPHNTKSPCKCMCCSSLMFTTPHMADCTTLHHHFLTCLTYLPCPHSIIPPNHTFKSTMFTGSTLLNQAIIPAGIDLHQLGTFMHRTTQSQHHLAHHHHNPQQSPLTSSRPFRRSLRTPPSHRLRPFTYHKQPSKLTTYVHQGVHANVCAAPQCTYLKQWESMQMYVLLLTYAHQGVHANVCAAPPISHQSPFHTLHTTIGMLYHPTLPPFACFTLPSQPADHQTTPTASMASCVCHHLSSKVTCPTTNHHI